MTKRSPTKDRKNKKETDPAQRAANVAISMTRLRATPDPIKSDGLSSDGDEALWKARWEKNPEDRWKVNFLAIYAKSGNVGKAIVATGISRAQYTRARKFDALFDQAMTDVWEAKVDDLEESAMERATKGSIRYTYDAEGNIISVERKYETALTIFMLQTNRARYNIKVEAGTSLEDVVNRFHDLSGKLRSSVPTSPSPSNN